MNEPSPQPLTLTVHSLQPPDLGDPAAAARRRTSSGRLRMLLVLAVCAAPVVASYLAYYVFKPQGRANYGALIDPPREWPPALPLSTLDGAAVAPETLLGQWLLVAAGPAACDAACERRLFTQRQLREMLGRERDRLDKVWLVTDAAPLRPELRRALEAPPAPVTVLRVPAAALARWLEAEAGQALDAHLYLVDPRGRWVMRMPAEPDPGRVRRDLDRLLRASSSWDRAGR
jgi:cytochrome oxidase Cu insertion factor (SCO1/SenC/PrrC family)